MAASLSTSKIIRDYFITVIIALSVALIVRNFIIEAYRIPSAAMKPTLISGDIIFVAKWPFLTQKNKIPHRGDVVVFSHAALESSPNFIKRVIGLPGDVVAMKKGQIILNGTTIPSRTINKHPNELCSIETLPEGKQYSICRDSSAIQDFGPEKIPEGSVFVMGDYRTHLDTLKRKGWGMIPLLALQGKALYIWLSLDPHTKSAFSFSQSLNLI